MYGEWRFFCSKGIVACRSIVHDYVLTECCTYLLAIHIVNRITRPVRGFSEICPKLVVLRSGRIHT